MGSHGVVKAQIEMLKTAWTEFRSISFELQSKGATEAIKIVHNEMHQRYQCVLGKLIDCISEKLANIELPTIKIP